jgi:hypothetical protein
MKRALALITIALLAPAERLDSIAVNIGKHVIAMSEVTDYIRLSAFLDSAVPDFSAASLRKAASQLADQYLILQDAAFTRATLPGEPALAPLLEPFRARYANPGEWQAALEKAEIREADLRAHLLAGLRLLRYTDTRFRPEVQITEENLRAYYEAVIARAAPGAGKQPTFEESREQLAQLLTNRMATQALDRWLEMARTESNVVYREAAFK